MYIFRYLMGSCYTTAAETCSEMSRKARRRMSWIEKLLAFVAIFLIIVKLNLFAEIY